MQPKKTFSLSLAGAGIGAVLMGTSISGALGPDEGMPASVAGVGGLLVLLVAGYFAVTSGLATWRVARLRNERNVVARWTVPAATWNQFCEIGLAQTGVDLPGLESLRFQPRRRDGAETVEVVCGRHEVQIDGRVFSVAPGRGMGLEEAGMTHTEPPCVALVIAGRLGGPHSWSAVRSLLLLPIPRGAESEAHRAIRHYDEAARSVRDLGDTARANPVAAKVLFWSILLGSSLAGAVGIWLEAADYPGALPGVLGIVGIMAALGTFALGVAFGARR
jgi:hypothetical protein